MEIDEENLSRDCHVENMETIAPQTEEATGWNKVRSRSDFGLTFQQPLEHYIHARHMRYLPSRTLANLTKDEDCKLSPLASVLPYATVRIPRTPVSPTEEHATCIASHIESIDKLMQDDPVSELLRLETLRDMPHCLTVKRSVKAKLSKSVSLKSKRKPINSWKQFKYRMSITFMKIGMTVREVMSTMELWYHPIKSIESHFGGGVATYFKFLRWLFIMNVINSTLSTLFITLPQSLIEGYLAVPFNMQDLLTGGGFFTNTVMYYGFYTNETLTRMYDKTYSIPSAYFITLLCCYSFTFIFLSSKVARSYRICYIETAGGIHNLYASKIFCGWDFSIASSKAANLCSASIYGELRELLAEAKKRSHPDCVAKSCAMFIQISMTAVVLTIISGTGVLLWILLDRYKTDSSSMLSLLIVPFAVTGIMHFFPAFISWLVRFERYNSERTALYVTMIRIYGMAAVVIGTLLVFGLTADRTSGCWQTLLAQEMYRFILVDFFVSIIGTFIAQAVHSKLHKTVWKGIAAPRFNIARNTLNLIYNQILFWVAFYFSPPMSLIIIIKMFLTFYIKKYGVLNHCEPPSRTWRVAQTHTLFLALVFLGMVGVLITLGYIITNVPSSDCGPFRGHHFTWEVVVERILQLRRDSVFWVVVTELTRPGVGAAILIAMCVAVYYLQAKAQAWKEMMHILREMLILEAHDKKFLLSGFSKIADKRWLYHSTPPGTPCSNIAEKEKDKFAFSNPSKSHHIHEPHFRVSKSRMTPLSHRETDVVYPDNSSQSSIEYEICERNISKRSIFSKSNIETELEHSSIAN